MLQQTTVATVARRFDAFLAKFPTPAAMADAPEEAVLSAWSGLGYYARARRLREAAAALARLPEPPRTASAWRALPGVGDYTAAAVASICFGEAALALDANLARVLARLSCEERPGDAKGVRDALGAFGRAMLSWERPGDFNQALMDLGAGPCSPGASPNCGACPLSVHCAAFAAEKQGSIPSPKASKKPAGEKAHRVDYAFALLRDGAGGPEVLLWNRPNARPYAGLWELPTWRLGATRPGRYPEADAKRARAACDWLLAELPAGARAIADLAPAAESTRHAITVYKVELRLMEGRADGGAAWATARAGSDAPMALASGAGLARWTPLPLAADAAQATPQRALLRALAKRLAGG